MRELLFRAKDELYKTTWRYGSYTGHRDFFEIFLIEPYTDEDGWIQHSRAVLPETVGQYTGILDKNGRKVFEGDIVKHDKLGVRTIRWGSSIGSKGLFEGEAAFMFDKTNSYLSSTHSKYMSVIGNIHDNPELMEVFKS